MRRLWTALISTLALVTVLAAPASARSLTVHADPNDGPRPDIRRVWTDRTPYKVFIKIGAWQRLRGTENRFSVLLDTRGTNDFDRVIEIGFVGICVVEMWGPDGLGEPIGMRDARRPTARTIACELPKSWFGIARPVRSVVSTGVLGESHLDRAPNQGRYRGL